VERINLNKVEESLLRLNDCDTHEDFIAFCVSVDDVGIATHSGILICYDEKVHFFHFDSTVHLDELDIDNIDNNLYIKKITIFGNEIILAFKAYCEILQLEVSPLYGFVFLNSFYNVDGVYYSDANLPDITTCVGFCINVIRGFLYNNDKYIEVGDWNSDTIDSLPVDFQYWIDSVQDQLESISVNVSVEMMEDVKNNYFKRIRPSELASSAFFENLPIRKVSIDFLNPTLENTLQLKTLV
jgi:hypothetical protein